jgi:GPI mannosyltransferase 1 subunit M
MILKFESMADFFSSPSQVFLGAILLRVVLFFYGLLQDANSPMKYTDIDYYVFTDASRFIARGHSPYDRETYRYTPLLAWMLLPTTWSSTWFSFGKAIFAVGDIVAGWLIVLVLRSTTNMSTERALKFASIWLLNPMVATISTRGSSEGLLGVMVIALLWAVMQRRILLAGILLGFGVHFKIYPFIYAPSIVWWLDDECLDIPSTGTRSILERIASFCNASRLRLAFASLATFVGLNIIMYSMYVALALHRRSKTNIVERYGWPFLQHTYLHHVTRIDHRHNFSPYNTLLYLTSSTPGMSFMRLESAAFIPQIFLSAIALPIMLAKKDLPSTLLAQTFAFVSFNKVCTSQVRPQLSFTGAILTPVVLPLVHGLPPILPPVVIAPRSKKPGIGSRCLMDFNAGSLVTARLPTRVFGAEYLRSRPLDVKFILLLD